MNMVFQGKACTSQLLAMCMCTIAKVGNNIVCVRVRVRVVHVCVFFFGWRWGGRVLFFLERGKTVVS